MTKEEITAMVKATKFKKTTVNTLARDGETPITLTGVAHAGLLVHTDQGNRPQPGYFVSHVVSGRACGFISYRTQMEAKAVAVRLAELGDWNRPHADVIADPALVKPAVALIDHCKSQGAFTPLPAAH